MSVDSCIACEAKRVKGSGFCAEHKTEHKKSPYPATLKSLMKLAKKVEK